MITEAENNSAGEPQPSYGVGKKVITITTLENLRERDREHTRSLSHAERMEYLLKLNQNLFGFDWSTQAEELRKGVIHIRQAS